MRGRLAACAVGAAVALVVAYLVFVRWDPGRRWDSSPVFGRWPYPENAVGAFPERVDAAGTVALVALAAAVVALLAGARSPVLAAVTVVPVAGSALTTQALKAVLGPDHVRAAPEWEAFPSGHTTVAVALAVAAVVAAPPGRRAGVAAAAAPLAAVVGLGTLTVGWHRAGDVVGGAAVALLWGAGLPLLVGAARNSRTAPARVRAVPVLAAALSGLLLAALALLAVRLQADARTWFAGPAATGGRALAQALLAALCIGAAVGATAWALTGVRLGSAAPRPDWDG